MYNLREMRAAVRLQWLRRLGWSVDSVETTADIAQSWNIPLEQVDSPILPQALLAKKQDFKSLFIVAWK